MGMYSTFIEQNIEVKDESGIAKLERELGHGDNTNPIFGTDIDFSVWDGHKIEGYWYDETRKILNKISPYIEGYVEFVYEEGWHFRIIFENGNVYYQRAKLDWDTNPKQEIESI